MTDIFNVGYWTMIDLKWCSLIFIVIAAVSRDYDTELIFVISHSASSRGGRQACVPNCSASCKITSRHMVTGAA